MNGDQENSWTLKEERRALSLIETLRGHGEKKKRKLLRRKTLRREDEDLGLGEETWDIDDKKDEREASSSIAE